MACIRKRRGKWVADYRSPDGKRRWITRDTQKAAQAALAQVTVAIGRDEYIAPDVSKTVQDAFDHWWRLCVEGSDNKRGKPVSSGTRGFYAGVWSRYFMQPKTDEPEATEARLAPRRLRSISMGQVAEWKAALSLRVGPRTVRAALQMLDALFKHAKRFGWVVSNPCESVHAPKYKAKVRAANPAELAAIFAKADWETALLVEVAAVTGLRESELFGVRFEDIDMASGMVTIHRQLQDGIAMDVKTEKSRRRVPLPASTLKKLREHARRFAGGLVFASPDGGPLRVSNFHYRVWKPLLKAAGVELLNERGRLTFHSLRHAAATAAIAAGENVQTVANLMGHANPQITLLVYADVWAAKVEQSAEGIADVLFGPSGSRTVAADTPRLAAVGDDDAQLIELAREGVVGREGVEPSTKRLRVSCSTN